MDKILITQKDKIDFYATYAGRPWATWICLKDI